MFWIIVGVSLAIAWVAFACCTAAGKADEREGIK